MGAASRPRRKSAGRSSGVGAGDEDVRMEQASVAETSQKAVADGEEEAIATKLPVRGKGADKTEAPQPEAPQEEGKDDAEDDSDDEAPEAVSTADAAFSARLMSNLAAMRREQHLNEQKRKHQARDARLKAQAAARKAEEEEQKKKKQENEEDEDSDNDEDEDEDDPRIGGGGGGGGSSSIQSVSKKSTHLSLEFLDSDEDDEELDGDDSSDGAARSARRRPKAAPRDRQHGSTVYRVLSDRGPQSMAPKMVKGSRNQREDLIRRRRPTRAAVQTGFIRKTNLPSMAEKAASLARTQRKRATRRRQRERLVAIAAAMDLE